MLSFAPSSILESGNLGPGPTAWSELDVMIASHEHNRPTAMGAAGLYTGCVASFKMKEISPGDLFTGRGVVRVPQGCDEGFKGALTTGVFLAKFYALAVAKAVGKGVVASDKMAGSVAASLNSGLQEVRGSSTGLTALLSALGLFVPEHDLDMRGVVVSATPNAAGEVRPPSGG